VREVKGEGDRGGKRGKTGEKGSLRKGTERREGDGGPDGGLQLSYPLLYQDQVKLRISNLTHIFTVPIRIKAH